MPSRLAHALATHPRRVLLATLAFLLVAGAVGGPVAGALKDSGGFVAPGADSSVANQVIERAGHVKPDTGVTLLVAHPDRARLRQLASRLRGDRRLTGIQAPAAVSRDGHSAIVTARVRAGADDGDLADDLMDSFRADRDVTVGGGAVANEQVNQQIGSDLSRAELLAFPLLLILSLAFFRRRAALIPLLVGLTTVLGTFLVLTAINQVYGVNVFALNLVIGLGLGLAIDYTLLLVTRFREEVGRDGDSVAAVGRTLRGSGRAVAFSGSTVAAALITLTAFPTGFLKSMGIGGAAVALVAAGTALLVTPALLALWGDKLGATDPDSGPGRWHRIAAAVMRRPAAVAGVTALIMLAVAAPATTVHWSPIDASVVPHGKSARTVTDALARDFDGGGRTPLTVAVTARPDQAAQVDRLRTQIAGVPGLRRVSAPQRLDATTWQIQAQPAGDPSAAAARSAVDDVRALPTPVTVHVTGDAATFLDQQSAIGTHLPLALGLVVVLTFAVLWLMTGSVVLPAKAIVMNALTVAAALAPLVLIYQHGRLQGLLGYTANGGVEPADFLVTATLVFALSTDYGVLLLSRIKELRDAGLPDTDAVVGGVGRTGRVITAAAILLAVAIGAFSTSSISFIQQIGVATASGVLIDAFVVRTFLVPSLMALLGHWNWWSPRPLRRLHAHVDGLEGAPEAA